MRIANQIKENQGGTSLMTYEDFFEKLAKSEYSYDLDVINEAYNLASKAHKGQHRRSGEDYISHPLEVAGLLIDLGLDTACIVASLLHDVVEDTDFTAADIKTLFGAEVEELVSGVTKLGTIPYSSKEETQIENLRKMFLATAKDIRVIIIKLADRLHNMRTLDFMPDEKKREISLETMEVYAPIAHRLGMQKWKIELEDIAIKYLDPVGCKEIEEELADRLRTREEFLDHVIDMIRQRFDESSFGVFIEGRVKHLYSIYRKVYGQNKTVSEIYDFYAVRIIVDNMNECYNVLGVIHDAFKPIPGRFKDYISTPKPNLYQSLHTTVIGKDGIPFEVQIRTWDMHRTAEYGIAAHWKYKQGITDKSLSQNLEWVNTLLEVQRDAADTEEFMRPFKVDFFADEVFVFTPNGDLVNLPAGATIVDFAYAIHSAVGNRMSGAKVNGKISNLDYEVSNGEIVEILTSSAIHGPSRDWLKIAKTSEAKNKIKQWFKKERREENLLKGKEDLQKELERENISFGEKEKDEILSSIAKRLGVTGVDDLYAAIGYGGISISRVIPRFKEEVQKLSKAVAPPKIVPEKKEDEERRTAKGVVVEGVDNCLIKYARCCNPLPGDEIIGYITKGYGISVHRCDCSNVQNSLARGDENERWLSVRWAGIKNVVFNANLIIIAEKGSSALAEITAVLSTQRVFIHAINAREINDGKLLINIIVETKDVEHIEGIINKIAALSTVLSVKRAGE